MTNRLAFSIPGEPQGKGRPRASARIFTPEGSDTPEAIVSLHTPRETRAAEAAVRDLFKARFPGHKPWTGTVMVQFTAVFQTPASFNRALQAAAASGKLYANKKPDKDNIEKMIVDALNGVAFHDDAQVHGGGVKRYGSPARIDVILTLIDQPEIPITPGQRRLEKKVDAADPVQRSLFPTPAANNPRKGMPGKKNPKMQAAIDAALARDNRR